MKSSRYLESGVKSYITVAVGAKDRDGRLVREQGAMGLVFN
jgi:hypothetical protein